MPNAVLVSGNRSRWRTRWQANRVLFSPLFGTNSGFGRCTFRNHNSQPLAKIVNAAGGMGGLPALAVRRWGQGQTSCPCHTNYPSAKSLSFTSVTNIQPGLWVIINGGLAVIATD